MKIFITGVSGMVGSHLLDLLLKKGHKVVGLDDLSVGKKDNIRHNLSNRNFRFVKGSILNKRTVFNVSKGCKIIVHLAAAKKVGEEQSATNTLQVNVQGTSNVFEAAKKTGAKVIFASTSDVYGTSTDIPFTEDGNIVIGSPSAKRWSYAASKIYGEQLAFAYHKEAGVPIVILRYFGGFSSRASSTWSGGHIPLFVKAVLDEKQVIIHGDGTQTRSMAYVDDIVNGTFLAMKNTKAVGQVFNIGNDEEVNLLDTVELIKRIARKKTVKIKFVPLKKVFGDYKEIKRRVPDLRKAKRILGYSPKITFRKALEKTIKAEVRARENA